MNIANAIDIRGSYISYFSNLVKKHGGINLAQGIPGFAPPAKLLEILSGIKHQRAHQYAPGTGNLELLEQLRKKYAGRYNHEVSDFFIVNGATEAISLIYTYLYFLHKHELKVLTFSPAYESYIHLPRLFGNEVFFTTVSDNGKIDLELFERKIVTEKIKLVFLCSPGNPRGWIIDKVTLSTMCDICEQNKCYMIIDAVYSELPFSSELPWYPTDRISRFVFYINSFSKLFSITGWRIGYLLAHLDNMAALEDIHDYIGLSSPAPLQAAIAGFIKDPVCQKEYLDEIRKLISQNYLMQSARLSDQGFYIPSIKGGYFIWARCPEKVGSGVEFAINLYNNQQTAVIPGKHFGREWENYIRINIALPPDILEAGINRVCDAVSD